LRFAVPASIIVGQQGSSKMPDTTISLNLPDALDEKLSEVATALNRPKSWVVEQAVREFVALQDWHLAAIDEGIAAADAGKLVTNEDVVSWVRSWGTPEERPMPECD
jgi:predicted transcriptional regulator